MSALPEANCLYSQTCSGIREEGARSKWRNPFKNGADLTDGAWGVSGWGICCRGVCRDASEVVAARTAWHGIASSFGPLTRASFLAMTYGGSSPRRSFPKTPSRPDHLSAVRDRHLEPRRQCDCGIRRGGGHPRGAVFSAPGMRRCGGGRVGLIPGRRW